MPDWLFSSPEELLIVVYRTLSIFLLLGILIRIGGLQTFSKMTHFDFAVTIAIGSIIAAATINSSVSILQTATAIAILILIQASYSWIILRSRKFEEITSNNPILLMRGGEIIHENLKVARVSKTQLVAKLREANVLQLSQVKAVVMETTGDISVLHSDKADLEVDEILFLGVTDRA